MQRARKEVVYRRGPVRGCRQRAVVDFLEKTLVTGTNGVGQLDVDNVPCHVTRLDLRLDLGDASAVILRNDAVTALRHPRLVIGLNLRFRVCTAPGHNREFGCHCAARDECGHPGESNNFLCQTRHIVFLPC